MIILITKIIVQNNLYTKLNSIKINKINYYIIVSANLILINFPKNFSLLHRGFLFVNSL